MRFWMMTGLLLLAVPATAQESVKNPNAVVFACADDHAQHTEHEIEIVRDDGTVLQVLLLGTAPADVNGEVTLRLNVQPIDFGRYTGRVRAVAGTWKGAWSDVSPAFERVPGAPGRPKPTMVKNTEGPGTLTFTDGANSGSIAVTSNALVLGCVPKTAAYTWKPD